MTRRLLLVLGASLWLTAALCGQALTGAVQDNSIFGPGKLHRVSVSVSRAEWDVLQTTQNNSRGRAGGDGGTDITQPDGRLVHIGGGFRGFFPWVHADLLVNGVELKDVGLRYKGNNSFVPPTAFQPFRVNLKVK